ncbi:MAG: prenyltransferase [Betaproteobacteria bacterium]|nr:prenyltransferase [Betaproteobacteria bacterium]
MPPAEPTLAAFPNPFLRYIAATRPAFLTVTFFSCLVGLASAWYSGIELRLTAAFVTVAFALVAHAGINVLNDYYDALNGTDAANVERIFPYTGGSRFIQNGVLSAGETAVFGFSLVALVIVAGLWLTWVSAPGLIWIGSAGLSIGWAYSAPPLKLNARGVGELCVAAGFSLIVAGTDFVQRGAFAGLPWVAALSYGLLVTNLLYINQFPDRSADESAGKRHWVVRIGPDRARWGYAAIGFVAYGWLVGAVAAGHLPAYALAALLSAPMTWKAASHLLRHATEPRALAPAIQLTIGAASVHGLLLAAGLVAARIAG